MPVGLVTTTGTRKSPNISVSGLTATKAGTSDAAVSADAKAPATPFIFEATVHFGVQCVVGVDDGTFDMSEDHCPGIWGEGISAEIVSGDGTFHKDGTFQGESFTGASEDISTWCIDPTTGTNNVKIYQNGTLKKTLSWTPATGEWWAWVGLRATSDSIDLNLAGPFAYPQTGFSAYDAAAPSAITGTASGTLALTGSAAATAPVSATATGSFAFTGSASGAVALTATAAGSLALSGSASGALGTTVTATASGSLGLTGSANAAVAASAAATGEFALSGSAGASVAIIGAVSGSVALTGASVATTADNIATGTASGTLDFGGTADVAVLVRASANDNLALVGSAAGNTGKHRLYPLAGTAQPFPLTASQDFPLAGVTQTYPLGRVA